MPTKMTTEVVEKMREFLDFLQWREEQKAAQKQTVGSAVVKDVMGNDEKPTGSSDEHRSSGAVSAQGPCHAFKLLFLDPKPKEDTWALFEEPFKTRPTFTEIEELDAFDSEYQRVGNVWLPKQSVPSD